MGRASVGFVALRRQLERLIAAELVTAEQAAAIEAFERGHERPVLMTAVAGIAAFAIAVGLVSIVAANWDAIPGLAKLVVDLVLVIATGGAVVRFEQRGPAWGREAAIVVLYGLVLASIALVGQVYQLGGKTHHALTLWSGLTALLMTRSRSGTAALVWIAGLQATLVSWLVWLGARDHAPEPVLIACAILIPIATLGAARLRSVRGLRPMLASTLAGVAWAELVLGASIMTVAFYEVSHLTWSYATLGPWIVGAAFIGFSARSWSRARAGREATALLVACAALLWGAPYSPGGLDVVAAVVFIALWGLVAVVAHRSGQLRLLNLATGLIGVRILIIYFEVFGTLLDTGIGLVVGGVLMLAAAWVWDRKRREFRATLTQGDAP